ncbi:MAG: hypothetical protein AAB392_03255 [Patescibacteria group bacterium]
MKKVLFGIVGLFALPFVASAELENVESIISSIGDIVDLLIPIVFALALLFFFWGVAMYIFGSDESKVSAKKTMLWGVVAIFVMAAVWGLVKFIGDALGVDTDQGAVDVDRLIPN